MKVEEIGEAGYNIGSTAEDISRVQFARPFRSLKDEVQLAISLALPRFGHSPRVASLKVIDACNLNCSHCNANKARYKQMDTGEISNVLGNLAQAGIQMVDITGGEPTLRDDLPQIISHAHDLGMLTTLNTNGGIRRDKLVEEYTYLYKLAEAGLFGITYSYDGVGEKTNPRVIDLAEFSVNTLHIYTGVRTVVTQDNLDKVPGIGTMCMRNNIVYQAVPAVALDGETSASSGNFKPLDYAGRQEFIRIIDGLSKVRRPFANFLRVPKGYLQEVVNAPDSNSWHCRKPSSHWISVDAQGNARICNDRSLSKTYSLIEQENPLFTKEFHDDVTAESEKCRGCSWLCHWEGNRNQIVRGFDQLRLFITVGSLT